MSRTAAEKLFEAMVKRRTVEAEGADGSTILAARQRENYFRKQVEEATGDFTERLHPRDRKGQFRKKPGSVVRVSSVHKMDTITGERIPDLPKFGTSRSGREIDPGFAGRETAAQRKRSEGAMRVGKRAGGETAAQRRRSEGAMRADRAMGGRLPGDEGPVGLGAQPHYPADGVKEVRDLFKGGELGEGQNFRYVDFPDAKSAGKAIDAIGDYNTFSYDDGMKSGFKASKVKKTLSSVSGHIDQVKVGREYSPVLYIKPKAGPPPGQTTLPGTPGDTSTARKAILDAFGNPKDPEKTSWEEGLDYGPDELSVTGQPTAGSGRVEKARAGIPAGWVRLWWD